MPLYPFCVIGDVQALNQHRPTYGAATKPTSTQVNNFMLEICGQITAICDKAGYDKDNFHETSDTVALAITAGTPATFDVTDGDNFSKGDMIKIEGLTSGVRSWEFVEISGISSDTLSATVISAYDASSVTVYTVNHALNNLRKINAFGAAWMAEEATFMGISPNRSEHAEVLKESYFGNKENRSGLWAIENIPGFLVGATVDSEAMAVRSKLSTYNYEHSTDSDIDPIFEKDEKF